MSQVSTWDAPPQRKNKIVDLALPGRAAADVVAANPGVPNPSPGPEAESGKADARSDQKRSAAQRCSRPTKNVRALVRHNNLWGEGVGRNRGEGRRAPSS